MKVKRADDFLISFNMMTDKFRAQHRETGKLLHQSGTCLTSDPTYSWFGTAEQIHCLIGPLWRNEYKLVPRRAYSKKNSERFANNLEEINLLW
jgi:hypothetical protein